MEVTPDQLLEVLKGCDDIVLTGPVEPDGDSVGACLGLQWVLGRLGVRADVAGDPGYRYAWMPGADQMVRDSALRADYDAVVILDGDRHRLLPQANAAFAQARVKAIVDHHLSTKPDGYTHCWIDRGATSTCSMIHEAWRARGGTLDRDLATVLYVGTLFDTGGFRYSNTTPETHRLAAELLATGIDHATIAARVLAERRPAGIRAAGRVYEQASFELDGQLLVGELPHALQSELGVVAGDLEGIVDALLHVVGVEVAALLIERPDGRVKASLRSRGRVNVADVAQRLSTAGGGHAKAAGASLAEALPEAREKTVALVREALGV